ncbi:unnamed protein product [Somion occarium]|uniref:DM2 domain-containing protein n=1 Tax=Somion occarium TaxID=3059160 RepID=A0ABP1DW58_9APHY
MSFSASSLEPRIRAILTSPGIDLTTISAKRVRKRLIDEDSSLTADLVRDNKAAIDAIISSVYEEVSQAAQGDEEGNEADVAASKRKREDADELDEEVAKAPAAAKKAKRPKKKAELTDAEIAKQLDQELNSRSRTSRAGTSKPKKATAKRAKKVKSAEAVDSDGNEIEGEKKKRGGGLNKEYALSEPLASLLSVDKLSRPQVVKQMWVYIKAHDLQNPEDKREILCDEPLKGIFHVDKMSMFKMNQLLGVHLLEPEP